MIPLGLGHVDTACSKCAGNRIPVDWHWLYNSMLGAGTGARQQPNGDVTVNTEERDVPM